MEFLFSSWSADWTTGGLLAIALESREHGAMTDDSKAEGQRFLDDFANADSLGSSALSKKGRDLARRLHSSAVDLGMDKATEFSPEIPALLLLAAKVAYVTFDKAGQEMSITIPTSRHLIPLSRPMTLSSAVS
jgi:hypothetical protein